MFATMRVPGRKFVRRTLRPLSRVLFPGALVLGYHRIASPGWDPLGLAVTPEHFSSHLEVLRNNREIVSLEELAARHAAAEPLARFAVLTFDDGYRDFADTVLPILEASGVPATVFVTTGFTGGTFWWDEVAALLAPGETQQSALRISTNVDQLLVYSSLDQPRERAATARALCSSLASAGEATIGRAVAQVRAWAGGHEAQPDGAAMSRGQLEALGRHPLVELGAHTVSHGCLAQLPHEAQRAEIEQNKADLEVLVGKAVRVFSYPNGSYSRDTPRLVEALGFACACTSVDGTCSSRTDRYRIPRLWAPDVPAPEFGGWLGNWATGIR